MSVKRLADVLAVVCDALYDLLIADSIEEAVRRLNEAAVTLGGTSTARAPGDQEGVAAVLRAIRHIGRAMEALAQDRFGQAEMQIESAAGALRSAVHLLDEMYRYTDAPGEGSAASPVQMNVTEALRVPNEDAMHDALRTLLHRSEAQAFVIFLDAHTGKFVQFNGSKAAPLVLDLPFSCLSEGGMKRAADFFREEGIDDARGEESFSAVVGRDVQQGARLAAGIFSRVFRSKPDFSLKIEEN